MVEPTFRGGDVALFIDWENFKISLAAGNRSPNLSSLKEEITEHGRVVVAKAYADWVTRAPELRGASQFINDPPSLYAAGIEPVFVPTRVPSTQASSANGMRTYRVKNSVDVKMTADCIECAHSYPNIGTFVLVSGDSDFLHVVNALRTMGKRVVIIGVSWSTSRRLADQVDSLLLYDKDVDPLAPQPAVLPQHANRQQAQNEEPELAEVIRAIEEIIRDDRAAGGQPLLTSIKQRLMRRYPGFDEKKLGFSGFKKLMGRVSENGNIKLIHAGLVDWAIMADEETPESATPESAIEEAPSGAAAARPGRRRGGRRRPGGNRDAEAQEDEAAEDGADSPVADADEVYAETSDAFTESPEETAATDFDDPAVADAADSPAEAVGLDAPAVADAVNLPADAGEEPEDAPAEPENPFANDAELADAVRKAIAVIALPAEPEDGQLPERVSDLVVMAHTLELQEGADQVVYNSLVAAICGALEQGLAAGNIEISQRWSMSGPRDYVSRMLRGLAEGGFFRRSTHHWREEDTGRRRRRSTFNLNRENELVGRMLAARLGLSANGAPSAEAATDAETPAPENSDAPQPNAESTAPENSDAPQPNAESTAPENPDAPQPDAESAAPENSDAPQPDAESDAPQPDAESAESAAPESRREFGCSDAPQPDAESAAPENSDAPQPDAESAAPENSDAPQPDAESAAPENSDAPQPDTEPSVEQGSLPVYDDIDDEPQPRNVRRRPFTSRLLRS